MTDKSSVLKLFNNHLVELMDDIILIFPEEVDMKTAKTFLENLKKVNPKSIIKTWYESISLKYHEEIIREDFSFFEDKDYSDDLSNDKILKTINKIRSKVKNTSLENKKKTMKYLQNLTKLSLLYFN